MSDLKARVLAAAQDVPSSTRAEASRRAGRLALLGVGAALASFWLAGGIAHSLGRPIAITARLAGGWALFCSLITLVVLRRGRSTLGAPPWAMKLAVVVTPIALVGFTRFFDGTYVEPYARFGWRCFAMTVGFAVLPSLALLISRRGAEPRAPGLAGAAIFVAAGAWASVVVDLWCPLSNLAHVLVGHALPLVLLAAVGARIGRGMLGVPRA